MLHFKVTLLGITKAEERKRDKSGAPIPIVQTWPDVEAEKFYDAILKCLPDIVAGPVGKAFLKKNGRDMVITDVLPFLRGHNHNDNREAAVHKTVAQKTLGAVLQRQKKEAII